MIRNGHEIMKVVRFGDNVSKILRQDPDTSLYNQVFPTQPWWFEYGTKADYVVSNGVDNWIDTWLPMASTAKDGVIIEMDLEYITIPSSEINTFGAVSGSGSSRNVLEAGSIVNGKESFYAYSSGGFWRVSDLNVVTNQKYKFRYEFRSGLQIFYADGVEIRRTTDTVNLTSSVILTLFARNLNGVRGGFANVKLYSLKMYKLDYTPIIDYMPLYVNKKPIQDQAGNTYAVGNYILVDNVREAATVLKGAPLEGAYTPWWSAYGSETPYVITNGTNNYIDTGVMTQSDLNIEFDFEYLKVDGTSEHLFGGVSGISFSRRAVELGFINAGQLTYAYGYSWVNTGYVPQQDTPYKLRGEFTNGSQIMYVNGEVKYTGANTTDFNDPISMYLFTRNEFGVPSANMATVKMRSAKVSKPDTEVLLDYVPIYLDKMPMTDDNGRVYPIGSYVLVDNIKEKVTKLYGDALTGVWWHKVGIAIPYIEGTGSQFIDLGIKGNEKTTFGMTFALTSTVQQQLAGSREGASLNNLTIVYPNNATDNRINIDYQNNANNRLATNYQLVAEQYYTAEASPTQLTFDSQVQAVQNLTAFETPTTLKLFSTDGVTYTNQKMIGRISKAWLSNDTVKNEYVPIQLLKSFTDASGKIWSAGTRLLVNQNIENDVPSHTGTFRGVDARPYDFLEGITFNEGDTETYIEFGKWKDYKEIYIRYSSTNPSEADVFLGRSAADGFVGYADTENMIINSDVHGGQPYTITPEVTASEKGNGVARTIKIEYTSNLDKTLTVGAYSNSEYSKSKVIENVLLRDTAEKLQSMISVRLKENWQGHVAGSVGLLWTSGGEFYGAALPGINFIAVE